MVMVRVMVRVRVGVTVRELEHGLHLQT